MQITDRDENTTRPTNLQIVQPVMGRGVYEPINWPLGDRVATRDDIGGIFLLDGLPYRGVRIECIYADGAFVWGRLVERLRDDGVPVLSSEKFYAEREQ